MTGSDRERFFWHPMSIKDIISLPDKDFLHAAYSLILGRDIDHAGLAAYGGQLSRGRAREAILADLARSKEAQSRFAPPEILALPEQEFIDAIYMRALGRNADADGMKSYLDQLNRHGNRLQIIAAIKSSDEARRRDADGWLLQQELKTIIRRQTSFLGWRKYAPTLRFPTLGSSGKLSESDRESLANDILKKCRAENEMLRQEIKMIAAALEGVAERQRQEFKN